MIYVQLTFYSTAECEETQINDPEDIFTCCEMHELGDGNQCACVAQAINDPEDSLSAGVDVFLPTPLFD